MSSKQHTPRNDNFLANLVTLIFIGALSFVFAQEFIPQRTTTRHYVATNTQGRLNSQNALDLQRQVQKLQQQQERHELRTARAQSFWNGVKGVLIFLVWCLAFALVVYVVMRLVKYTRHVIATTDFNYLREKNWQEMTLSHERQLAQIHVKQLAASQVPGLFQGASIQGALHYSPRHSDSHNFTQHSKASKILDSGSTGNSPDWLEPLAAVDQLPTFTQALNDSTESSLVLGYNEQSQPIHGTLDSLYSFGVGGMSGSGKTSTVVWLLSQSVMQGAKLIVIDPHAGNSDSLASKLQPLSSAYLCNVATTQDEMLHSINYAQSIFDARKSGLDQSKQPVIIVCDEWLNCMRGNLQDAFQTLAEAISQEGRKYQIIGAFLSQKWSVQKSGDMRDTLTSHIITRTRPNLARQQTGLPASELPSDVMSLQKGEFYMLSTSGDMQKLRAPFVTQEDLKQLAKTITVTTSKPLQTDFKPTSQTEQSTGLTVVSEALSEVTGSTSQKQVVSAEEANILQLFKAGNTIAAITKTISGAKGGKKYQDTMRHVNDVLRQSMA